MFCRERHLNLCTAWRWWRTGIILRLRHVRVAVLVAQEYIDEIALKSRIGHFHGNAVAALGRRFHQGAMLGTHIKFNGRVLVNTRTKPGFKTAEAGFKLGSSRF